MSLLLLLSHWQMVLARANLQLIVAPANYIFSTLSSWFFISYSIKLYSSIIFDYFVYIQIFNQSLSCKYTSLENNFIAFYLLYSQSQSPSDFLLRLQTYICSLTFFSPVLTLNIFSNSYCEVAQSCPTLCNPMDCSLPGSSVHGIFQTRILEWVAISFSRGSS